MNPTIMKDDTALPADFDSVIAEPEITPQNISSATEIASHEPEELQNKQKNIEGSNMLCIPQCRYKGKNGKKKIIRCNICLLKVHPECVGESTRKTPEVWNCLTCRRLPVHMSEIQTKLAECIATNNKLLNLYTNKVTECDNLRDELLKAKLEIERFRGTPSSLSSSSLNSSEKQRPNNQTQNIKSYADTVKEIPKQSLLIGDSLLRKVDPDSLKDTIIYNQSGATVKDIDMYLDSHSGQYDKIMIVVGTNDIKLNNNASSTLNDFKKLITSAKYRAEKVLISSIPPRIDLSMDKQLVLETVNANLMEMCVKESCEFVNNDYNFRTADNSISESLLHPDGCHLNYHGTKKLLSNLGLQVGTISIDSQEPVSRTFTKWRNTKHYDNLPNYKVQSRSKASGRHTSKMNHSTKFNRHTLKHQREQHNSPYR